MTTLPGADAVEGAVAGRRSPTPVRDRAPDRGRFVGVDGCRGGWIAVPDSGAARAFATFADLARAFPAATIAIDIPIGLERGHGSAHRPCDTAAAAALGARRSCVFPAPRRGSLALARRPFAPGHGVSAQTHGIMAKIAQIDRWLARHPGARVFEAHPELAFLYAARANGIPPAASKKTPVGRRERERILRAAGAPIVDRARIHAPPGVRVGADDAHDAAILSWTAQRIARRVATRYGAAAEAAIWA